MPKKLFFVTLLIAECCLAPFSVDAQPIPVIFDTDIGADIDDAWSLALLLCSPELDLKLVVTNSHDTVKKAKIVAKFLDRMVRDDVKIGIGQKTSDKETGLQPWADKDFRLPDYPGDILQDGIQAMVDTIMGSDQKVTVLVSGPFTNLAAALQKEPQIADKIAVIATCGSIARGYDGLPTADAEYNIRSNPDAARNVFSAPWDLIIAPLDVTGNVAIREENYRNLLKAEGALGEQNITVHTVLDAYRSWTQKTGTRAAPDVRSTPLYDVLSVFLAFDRSYCVMREMKLIIDYRAFTVPSPTGKNMQVAAEWKNIERRGEPVSRKIEIEQEIVRRLVAGVVPKKKPKRIPIE
jgi:inosine-uridine nucleoside N-ribohydrolase